MAHRTYYVYILASRSRRIYTGVTRDLARRVWEHRTGVVPGHTARYAIGRLVYYESTENVAAAIAREKQIKAWTREKRVALVESTNAGWIDLAEPWFAGAWLRTPCRPECSEGPTLPGAGTSSVRPIRPRRQG